MKFFVSALLSLAALSTAAPAAVQKRWPSGVIIPSNSYIYHQSPNHPPPDFTPKIQGVVNFRTSTSEVHVFSLPSDWIGKKVQVGFWYNDAGGVATNTAVDIFSSSRTPPNDLIGSNNRDQQLARFYVQAPGDATVRPGEGPSGWKSFQLPAGVGSVAFEVVGVGSVPETNFSYEVATSGVYLRKL